MLSRSSEQRGSGRLLSLLCRLLVVLPVAFGLFPWSGLAATPLADLQKKLAQEQSNATERRQSLKRLTEEERKLNAGLAEAEKRVLDLEKRIAGHQDSLLAIGSAEDKARKEHETLLAERAKTEKAQAETLRLLWELTAKRLAVGRRDMADWAETDREYSWSKGLYASLETYHSSLKAQETKLARVLAEREELSRALREKLSAVNEEKNSLLKSRLDYDRQLAALRRKRGDAEDELKDILKLVGSLNFEIARRSSGEIRTMKGSLPLPVNGKMRLRYAPDAKPASRGVGFSTVEKTEVRAVAGGRVVHNDVLRGFGTVLIVQHGNDYYSLYAFLDSCPLQVGQTVENSQTVGTTGYYPAIKGPGLYFELRFKQKAINPEQWFAS